MMFWQAWIGKHAYGLHRTRRSAQAWAAAFARGRAVKYKKTYLA